MHSDTHYYHTAEEQSQCCCAYQHYRCRGQAAAAETCAAAAALLAVLGDAPLPFVGGCTPLQRHSLAVLTGHTPPKDAITGSKYHT
jgi:hypothetical protein